MLSCAEVFSTFESLGLRFYTGVPDSLFKHICAYITDHAPNARHVIAANEGNAIALAVGHHLATGETPLVYLQNSGHGNIINPLLSLADPSVYAIPMVVMIGWRGRPGGKADAVQHHKQGEVTEALLASTQTPYRTLSGEPDEARRAITEVVELSRAESRPVALLAPEGLFEPYALQTESPNAYPLTREQAIAAALGAIPGDAVVVGTTGMPSREIFEFRSRAGEGLDRDFLTVGSMGHASSIALGIALAKPDRRVYCFDGDGAAIMHLGAMAIIGARGPRNLRHVVFNTGAHDSVGGQPTVAFDVDLCAVARGCGYGWTRVATDAAELEAALAELDAEPGPAFLEVRVARGARKDLGRPTATPLESKQAFMKELDR